MKLTPNVPLVTGIYTADPSAHVFPSAAQKSPAKLYIYPSHDLPHNEAGNDNGDQYKMEDYHVLRLDEAPTGGVWTDCGEALHIRDVPWASRQMWAPDAAYKNGVYYLFFPARDKNGIFRIGVATASWPEGRFTPQPNYLAGSFSIDPAVFTDEDGKTYLYFGGLSGGQLENWQTGEFLPNAAAPQGEQPALCPYVAELSEDLLSLATAPQPVKILDETGAPLLAKDENRRFFEAVWLHKYKDLYYLSYSTGTTHFLVYAVGTSPLGPFTYRGRILNPVSGWTTHHSIAEYDGQWYLFYHDCTLSGGIDHERCVKCAPLTYNPDGTIQTIYPDKMQ